MTLEVLFTPADFAALKQRDLSGTVCVVFDVLRATSTMVTALANGAEAIVPVEEIPEALAIRQRQPGVLLAGERDGVRIQAHLTGSIPFDLGNSPREFTADKVHGRTIAMSTTNGTRALRACAHAKMVLVASFLNLGATADYLKKAAPAKRAHPGTAPGARTFLSASPVPAPLADKNVRAPGPVPGCAPRELLLVCSGTHDQAAYEDVLGAGALCDLLWSNYSTGAVADTAHMARSLYLPEQHDLPAALGQSRNGARLLALPELREDVPFCAQRDTLRIVAGMCADGSVRLRT